MWIAAGHDGRHFETSLICSSVHKIVFSHSTMTTGSNDLWSYDYNLIIIIIIIIIIIYQYY